ncbi:hypothetical protein Lal_00028756 [Lupinus albus]|uniref:Uncharacterized protein n=1 Tax=Lupinus albus TaxID=3870 RepID=A0A6A4P3Z7_LUPAL|nr:hypothetical protein Lalb_Chr19g0138701 [Lupinus albus]KAF1884869.1 hypothetical protein Lal_00028756 [Lupinus albus]
MMPSDIVQACHQREGVDAQVMHGYKSAWMAHWKHTNYKSATTAARNRLLNSFEVKEIKEENDAEQRDLIRDRRPEVAIDGSVHAGGTGEADRDTWITFSNGVNPGKSKNTSLGSKSFPIFRKKTDGISSLKRVANAVSHGKDRKYETEACSGEDDVSIYRSGSHLPSTSSHAPLRTATLVRENLSSSTGISTAPLLMKSPYSVEQNNLVSTSLWNGFLKSASDKVPNGNDKGKTSVSPSICGQHKMYQSSYKLASQEHFTRTKYHSYSLLIRKKKKSSLLDPPRFSFPRWFQGGDTHLQLDPIAGSGDGYSTDNVETMKIYTSIDSVEESSRDHPKISQTTRHFLMSKKTDANFSGRGQFFRESIAPTKFKGNAFNEMEHSSPSMSDHDLEGVKLEALGSSKKSEGKENIQEFNSPSSLKNESSAETDTMDIYALHRNHFPGNVPFRTNKCSEDSQSSPTSQVAITSTVEKNKGKLVYMAVPDINQEPPKVLTMSSSLFDREASTSRIHSLDVEHLLSHADKHARSKYGTSSLGPDPSSRWVKRLKLCLSSSAHGTNSATMGETSSPEQLNNMFRKMKGRKTSLEQKMACQIEEQMVPDLCATALANNKSSTEENKTAEITLSHPWIQRWYRNHDVCPQKRHELSKFHEPSSKTPEEFQKKQFPSIAAMAMMGKAMNCLNPCELMEKGPVVVWNMKGF